MIPAAKAPDDPFLRVPINAEEVECRNRQLEEDDVLRIAAGAFDGQMRWSSCSTVHNVNQPVLLAAAAIHGVTSAYNPNVLWDLVSGHFRDYERAVVQHLAHLAGWGPQSADGVSTFGGKAGLIYALKCGVNRVAPNASVDGIPNPAPVVLTSDETHYSVESAAALLGMGTSCVRRIPTEQGVMRPEELRSTLRAMHSSGERVAAIVLGGGSTLDGAIDPVAACIDVAEAEMGEDRPWLHVDLALGWPWLYFLDYDWLRDPLQLPSSVRPVLVKIAEQLRGVSRADSFGVDFHKLGFAPYSSAFFVCRDWAALRSVFGSADTHREHDYGQNFAQHHTIEHSRSGEGILAAWTCLQLLGADGFRSYIAHLHALTLRFRDLAGAAGFEIYNDGAPSFATLLAPPAPDHISDARQCDAFTEHVFMSAVGLGSAAQGTLALGYIPQYTRGAGSQRSVLRVYLCNPHLTEDRVAGLVDQLTRACQAATQTFVMGDTHYTHTPR
ncbi:pyridoxal phosphate-dependent decarboxylase family protein [Cutibacterium avidum]|uniref:pyridoxal phosphate-dependent decarboxylase family protein n=1 Tax=Cutibacterium avidum TaxID=33010 RepID=UPI00338FDD80